MLGPDIKKIFITGGSGFFGKNFISINKSEYVWDQLKAQILKIISH